MSTESLKNICDLHEDLLSNILLRLDADSLIKVKCVCKSWYSLIKSSSFIAMQLNISKDDCFAFVIYWPDEGFFYKMCKPFLSFIPHDNRCYSYLSNLHFQFHNSYVIGCCNGLLCTYNPTPYPDEAAACYNIINPITRQTKSLICQEPNLHDPTRNVSYGFGFDPKANDYKLVRVVEVQEMINKAEVLTLRNNSWRSLLIATTMEGVRVVESCSKAVINNTLHWIGRSTKEIKNYLIVSFDLADDVFRNIRIPNIISKDKDGDDQDTFYNSSVLEGSLSISAISGIGAGDTKFEVWVMKDYGVEGSWTKQYCFVFKYSLQNDNLSRRLLDSIGVSIKSTPLNMVDMQTFVTFLGFCLLQPDKDQSIALKLLFQYRVNSFSYRKSLIPIN